MITISEEHTAVLEDNNTCYLNGDINAEIIDYAVRFMLEKHFQKDKPDHLNLIINTFGGEVNQCFALIDIMNSISIPVHTYAVGQIYSCGIILFAAGTKGHRYLFPHCSIMAHQWSCTQDGKKDEIEARDKENKLVTKRIMDHFVKCSGKKKSEVEELFFPRVERYFTSQEAIKSGIADSIVQNFNQ